MKKMCQNNNTGNTNQQNQQTGQQPTQQTPAAFAFGQHHPCGQPATQNVQQAAQNLPQALHNCLQPGAGAQGGGQDPNVVNACKTFQNALQTAGEAAQAVQTAAGQPVHQGVADMVKQIQAACKTCQKPIEGTHCPGCEHPGGKTGGCRKPKRRRVGKRKHGCKKVQHRRRKAPGKCKRHPAKKRGRCAKKAGRHTTRLRSTKARTKLRSKVRKCKKTVVKHKRCPKHKKKIHKPRCPKNPANAKSRTSKVGLSNSKKCICPGQLCCKKSGSKGSVKSGKSKTSCQRKIAPKCAKPKARSRSTKCKSGTRGKRGGSKPKRGGSKPKRGGGKTRGTCGRKRSVGNRKGLRVAKRALPRPGPKRIKVLLSALKRTKAKES